MESNVLKQPAGLAVEWRGRERYAATWGYQRACHAALKRNPQHSPDRLVLVEHEPVVTLGRHGDPANLPGGAAALAAAGIDFHRIERGGDITYHGPGQLVGYPLVDLRRRGLSLREFMRGLEEALIRTLGEYGLEAGRIPGLTGVWALPPPRAGGALPRVHHKLAAIGVAVQGGVTYHGFALNVAPDLSHFGYIVPCGIADRPVGSLELLLAPQPPPSMEAARTLAVRHLRSVFGYGD